MKKRSDPARRPDPEIKEPKRRGKNKNASGGTVVTDMKCSRCGSTLLPWQRYCADCGANLHRHFAERPPMYFLDPEDLPEEELIPTAEVDASGQQNAAASQQPAAQLEKRRFSVSDLSGSLRRLTKIDIVGLAEAVAIVILTAAVVVAAISRASFGGSYALITDGAAQEYTFAEDGVYFYTDADDAVQKGSYMRNKNKITLTDADGRKSELIHAGSYLCPESARYDNKFVRSEREQTLTRVISLMYEGGTLRTTRTLELHKDHTCRIEVVTTFIGDELEAPIVREGTYHRWGSRLILRWDDGFTETERLIGGYLYYNIYQKR